jgi:serine/threonine protein phosphatase 1
MNNRIFAIGDVHGHYTELISLLEKLQKEANFDPYNDHLVLLGDLVDNGGQVKEVLDFAIAWTKAYPERFHVVKGNHEDMMIDALNNTHPKYGDYYIWWNQGGRATLKSYTDEFNATDFEKAIMQPLDYITTSHIEFIKNLPLYWQTQDYFFCHAGLRPGKRIDETDFNDPKVQDDLIWIREEFYMQEFDFGKKVIFAHSPFQDIGQNGPEFVVMQRKDKIGINTMPRNFGHLTAVELPVEKFYTSKEVINYGK